MENISSDYEVEHVDYPYSESSFSQEVKDVSRDCNEMMTKNGEVWQCNICGKSAKDKSNLKRHVGTHVEGEAYPCISCGKTFRSKHSLQNHNSNFHKNMF